MSLKIRNKIKLKNRILVVKLSSLAITKETGGVDGKLIKEICEDISELKNKSNLKIIIVSSGAINAGRLHFKLDKNPSISKLQGASAVGQPILMQAFQKEFQKSSIQTAQVLLTHEDLKNRKRSLNIRSSLLALLEQGIIPIINENDTVSFDEITVGDNDQLSAMICETIDSNLLCMLTKTDGLYTDDPSHTDAKHIPTVDFKDNFEEIKTLTKSSAGRGGMKTKLLAVRKLTPLGIDVIIGTFKHKRPITRLLTQNQTGTFFKANPKVQIKPKKQWILSRTKNEAIVKIDEGAFNALNKNASLLPVGIIQVYGNFNRGDCIKIQYQKKIVAHGITEYSSKEVAKIKQKKSSKIKEILDFVHAKVVVHKNNLVMN